MCNESDQICAICWIDGGGLPQFHGVGWGGWGGVGMLTFLAHVHMWDATERMSFLAHAHMFDATEQWVGWGGVGWGGDVNVPCTCTHVGCYGEDVVPCTCTHVWCYGAVGWVGVGWGGVGMLTFLAHVHMWDATERMSFLAHAHMFDATEPTLQVWVRYTFTVIWGLTMLCNVSWSISTTCVTPFLQLLLLSTKHGCSPNNTCASRRKRARVAVCFQKFRFFWSWVLLFHTMFG